jgi:hypothetical protein
MEVDEDQFELDLDKITQDLTQFLARNPDSKIELSEATSKRALVKLPWGDPSVEIVIPLAGSEQDKLVDCLNNVILPRRLSALYHVDTRELEVIFTARALSNSMKQIDGRSFDFNFEGDQYNCRFDTSSERLLAIAEEASYPQHSDSAFRNLMSFTEFTNMPDDVDGEFAEFIRSRFGRPLSFWVSAIDWDEEKTLSILRHISFYMRYYDSVSPFILIHPADDSMSVNPKERYVHGDFPKSISSRQLNPSLISFYLAAADALPENKFLYCYRIIEFVSSNYLKNDKLVQVKKILSNPALLSSLDSSIDRLVGLIREDKPDNVNRFKAVVNELVRGEVVWPEICGNPDAFTKSVEFDGGFTLPKIVDGVDDITRLGPTVMQAMAGSFRNIRNALAHGGEEQAGRVILPTARNEKLLQPWVHLIVVVAGEVVLHENHT